MIKANTLWNAQRNLNAFLNNEIDANSTYAQVASDVYNFYGFRFPESYWLVYVYENVKGQSQNSWKCKGCFATLNVKNKYNVIVASIPTDSVPNTDIVNNSTFDDMINNYDNANDFVNDVYDNNCVQGVFATVNGV